MKLPVASYSFLHNWDICRHRTYRMYIKRDLPREPETPEMKWGNVVHEAMEKRIRFKGKSAVLTDKTAEFEPFAAALDPHDIDPEQKLGTTADGFSCDFFADNVFLRGKLDAPIVLNDTALLLDWKTGKTREEPFELEVQAVLLQAKWPRVRKILGQYVWLKDARMGKTHDLSDTRGTWSKVCGTMRDVQAAIEQHEENEAWSKDAFPKTQGPLCGYCPVVDCQHNRRKT